MKLSISKPNFKHKKILSLNINSLKNSNIQEEENIKDRNSKIFENVQNFNKNNEIIINNNNNDSNNSSQVDWVKSAIEVKTENNQIIKLSLENDNLFEQSKIEVNKLQKCKELNNKHKYNINQKKIKNSKNSVKNNDINFNLTNLNKNENKDSGYMMVSTKESEKLDNNFIYLSNRKNKNTEMLFPEFKKNNDDNAEEDIVNMKSSTLFNINKDLINTNSIKNQNKLYKKRIKTGYFNNKNNSKKFFNAQLSDTRNQNNVLKIMNYTNENINMDSNKNNKRMISFYLDNKNKNNYHKNIFNNSSLCKNNNINNNTIISYITPYLNNKNKLKSNESHIKEDIEYSNYLNTRTTKLIENINYNNKNDNNNNSIFQTYKFITPNKINKIQKYSPILKFIKKKISQKYLLKSYNKSNILLSNFLSQINLQKYYSILKSNGFDNINLLIEQMKTNIPIKDLELKKSGINKAGDRAKILIRLEEKGNVFPFPIPKNVYYCLENNINDNNNINEDQNIVQLKRWLNEFKMEKYLNNFIDNGYYSVELFLFQMISKNPISDEILQFDIRIEKIGHRSRILSILKEQSKNMREKLIHKESINFTDETKDCGCFTY